MSGMAPSDLIFFWLSSSTWSSVWGLRFRVQGLGCRVEGLGCRV